MITTNPNPNPNTEQGTGMTKKKIDARKGHGSSRALVPVTAGDGVPTTIHIGRNMVDVDAVYHVRSVHPVVDGPWALERDKIAWTDPLTGLGCIILRNGNTGHLGGYVGVRPDHPLHGWLASALFGAGLTVHGGVRYAAACQADAPEPVSICHVSDVRASERSFERSRQTRGSHRAEERSRQADATRRPEERLHENNAADDDLWWIGFECDTPADALPRPGTAYDQSTAFDGLVIPEYRDEAYVFDQCRSLAAQLDAIARDEDPRAAVIGDPPALGIDPTKARRS